MIKNASPRANETHMRAFERQVPGILLKNASTRAIEMQVGDVESYVGNKAANRRPDAH